MSFSQALTALDEGAVPSALLSRMRHLLEPASPRTMEQLALEASALTRQHFGRTMRLFAPLYVSNECVNNCAYCGFSRDNPILRTTLTVGQVTSEARHLASLGFRHLLLVAGEHPRFVSEGYLEECLGALRREIPTLAIEVGPMETPEYCRMVAAGCEGLVVYQETYDREAYRRHHTAGPKKNFDWRLDCPERGYAAGFRRIGVGALLGLSDWRGEVLRLAAHLEHLQRTCWKAHFTLSLPRLRPAAGAFEPTHPVGDADFVQALLALRLCFPNVGIVLSTRESAALRDALFPLVVTSISAGSHTEPGGYTGEGADDVHLTVRGRRVELDTASAPGIDAARADADAADAAEAGQDTGATPEACAGSCAKTPATGQFDIADHRSPAEVAAKLRNLGLEPVWKDWDAEILSPASAQAPLGLQLEAV